MAAKKKPAPRPAQVATKPLPVDNYRDPYRIRCGGGYRINRRSGSKGSY